MAQTWAEQRIAGAGGCVNVACAEGGANGRKDGAPEREEDGAWEHVGNCGELRFGGQSVCGVNRLVVSLVEW